MEANDRNIAILHCKCGRQERITANTNSGVLLKAEKSPWHCNEHEVRCGGNIRGVCPECYLTPAKIGV